MTVITVMNFIMSDDCERKINGHVFELANERGCCGFGSKAAPLLRRFVQ